MCWRRWPALLCGLVILAAGSWSGRAVAQAWPTQPLKLVVPYPAGGNADAIGRLVMGRVAGALGQTLVVENRAGAGGTIGAQAVARAPADGYTFLLAPTANLAITP
jgi:tripartite-type tricarboxylate transporter receptor subunit TctC